MIDGIKRKLAASMVSRALRDLATNAATRTRITGIIAGAVLAVPGLDFERILAGDLVQIAHVGAGLLVAVLGFLAKKPGADGKATLIGVIAGALYMYRGGVEEITTGVIIAVLGHMTNKGPDAKQTAAEPEKR